MKKQSYHTGVLFMLLSGVTMSLIGLFGKLGSGYFSLTSLIFWRFLAAFIMSLTLVWTLNGLRRGNLRVQWKMHLLRAGFVLVAQYSFYYYISRGSLLNGTVLWSTGPLFIPIIEWLVLRKPIPVFVWSSLIVSFFGVVCILQPNEGIFSKLSAIGLLAGVCQGGSQVVFGINIKEERADLGILYLMFLSATLSFIPFLIGETISVGETGGLWVSVLLVLALGATTVLNQMSRSVAYQHGSPSKLAVFLYISVIIAGFWDWLVFGRVPNLLSVIGVALVIFGAVQKVYWSLRKNDKFP